MPNLNKNVASVKGVKRTMIAAVDIGASKTFVSGFDEDGGVVDLSRFDTLYDKDEVIEVIIDRVSRLGDFQVVSIGVAGSVKNGKVTCANNLPWRDWPLGKVLEKELNVPVFIENDANLAAIAEIRALENIPTVGVYATISTGIGIGIIVGGRLPGEFSTTEAGLIQLQTEDGLMDWEKLASGKAIKEKYGNLAKDLGDKPWQEITESIGLGLLTIIPVLRPEAIVFGGSIGTQFDRFEKTLNRFLDEKLPKTIERPRLSEAKYDVKSVLFGCRLFALDSMAKDKKYISSLIV